MILNQSDTDTNESQTMEALVPMVDLFAVLAIMFMIYSNDEIAETKLESAKQIKELVAKVEQKKDETQARRAALAQKSGKSLQEIKREREQKGKELIAQFSKMIAAQQSQADEEYHVLVAKIEYEHEVQMKQEAASMEEEKRQELEREKQNLKVDLEIKKMQLDAEKQIALSKLERKNEGKMRDALSQAEAVQEAKVAAAKRQVKKQAEQAKTAALAKQKAKIQQQLAAKLSQAERQHAREKAAAEAAAEAEKRQALADAAKQKDAEKRQALADAAKQKDAEKRQALADAAEDAAKQQKAELAQQKAALDQDKKVELENQKALLGNAADQLAGIQKAADAKNKIVEQLNKNFKDFDSDAVEIDKKTGKVKLHFQNSYFVRGAYELSEDMKAFLRIMIPKYAKSIYGNKDAAKLVQSLKISGMTSPVHRGKYVGVHDTSGRSERARSFNMALSNKRAIALYNFIFDAAEMGDYQYRNRLKADMGIAALGYQKAKPVPAHLVGRTADCIDYDCKKEQATILQFKLHVVDGQGVY